MFKIPFQSEKRLTSLLGLALDGNRLDGVVLRRVNGAIELQQRFSVTLSLDPLTATPELAGREIRNQLEAAGIRERQCVLGLPLKWVLTAQTEVPPLPEADTASLLQLEAERGFPTDAATLQLAYSRCPLPADHQLVILAGIPRLHLAALEQVLLCAKLKPLSFTIASAALQNPASPTSNGVMTLAVGETSVTLQISCGGGLAALRALEGAINTESGQPGIQVDVVAREARITLGQLPSALRAEVKNIRIFGPQTLTRPLADELELRFETLGLKVSVVDAYSPGELGATIPPNTAVSAALSLAARTLTGQVPALEFLPPKPTLLENLAAKYSSGRLRAVGAAAGTMVALVGGLFLFQQIQLWQLRSQWSKMSPQVSDLQDVEDQIRQFRPWFDNSFRNLSILRQLTQAFPEDGAVTAKNIEIREDGTINCSGNARDNAALLATLSRLRAAEGVSGVKIDLIHGKTPMQFTFEFRQGNGGSHEN